MDNNGFNNSQNNNGDYSAPERNYYQENAYQQDPYQQNVYQQDPYQQNVYQQGPYQQNAYQQNAYQQNAYQQNTYQQGMNHQNFYGNMYQMNDVRDDKVGMAIASLVLGIVSIVLCITCVSLITGPLAIIFGAIYLASHNKRNSGMAIAGIICASIGIIGTIGLLVSIANSDESILTEIRDDWDYDYNENYYYNTEFDIDEL